MQSVLCDSLFSFRTSFTTSSKASFVSNIWRCSSWRPPAAVDSYATLMMSALVHQQQTSSKQLAVSACSPQQGSSSRKSSSRDISIFEMLSRSTSHCIAGTIWAASYHSWCDCCEMTAPLQQLAACWPAVQHGSLMRDEPSSLLQTSRQQASSCRLLQPVRTRSQMWEICSLCSSVRDITSAQLLHQLLRQHSKLLPVPAMMETEESFAESPCEWHLRQVGSCNCTSPPVASGSRMPTGPGARD